MNGNSGKKINAGTWIGDQAITDEMHVAFRVSPNLFIYNVPPQDGAGQSTAVQEDLNGITGVTPEILTNLTHAVGIQSGAGVDVLLQCSDIPGVIKYEIRVTPV